MLIKEPSREQSGTALGSNGVEGAIDASRNPVAKTFQHTREDTKKEENKAVSYTTGGLSFSS